MKRLAHLLQDFHSIGEMANLSKTSNAISDASVTQISIDEEMAGQRIDNFLARILKGVPKSHIYRILRSGEVRVNKKRIDATYRLIADDVVRIPPVRVSKPADDGVSRKPVAAKFEHAVLFEDDAVLVLDKPAGFAVHGGSGISLGVIEQLRLERPHAKFLELVHRLDRETSGVLMLAKKRSALVGLHEAMRANKMEKRYVMLVHGDWTDKKKHVSLPLHKYVLPNGERRVAVQADGQHSETIFHLRRRYGEFTLLEAQLITGRTHQLRVQLAHLGFPIAGDDKYGDFSVNKAMQKRGLKRMFLHSEITVIRHPISGDKLKLQAPLPKELEKFLNQLDKEVADAKTI